MYSANGGGGGYDSYAALTLTANGDPISMIQSAYDLQGDRYITILGNDAYTAVGSAVLIYSNGLLFAGFDNSQAVGSEIRFYIGMTTNSKITSTLASGTSPFSVTSTTLNTNLNADYLDGQHGSYYLA